MYWVLPHAVPEVGLYTSGYPRRGARGVFGEDVQPLLYSSACVVGVVGGLGEKGGHMIDVRQRTGLGMDVRSGANVSYRCWYSLYLSRQKGPRCR